MAFASLMKPSSFPSSSPAKFVIGHFERHNTSHHLQIACLGLQLSSVRDNGGLSAAASLLGLLHSLNTVVSFTYARSRTKKNCACDHGSSFASDESKESVKTKANCVADHGSSYASDQSKESIQTKYARSTWINPDGLGQVSAESSGDSRRNFDAQNSNPIDGNSKTELKPNEVRASNLMPSTDTVAIPVKEPIYEVLEVRANGSVVTKAISRRALLKTSGLRLRDIRSVDPSLWVTNSAPALLIRDQAILLNLGSLRAIASANSVLIFDHRSVGAVVFLELLLQRLNPESNPSVPAMPFELEVVEAALLSRTQRLERRLMEVEPRVLSLLEVLPNCLTANVLEELRLSKQALVELGSKANALRQMLLELLESPQEIRRMTIMGRRCTISREDGSIECIATSDKQLADDEEEEMEMLLENYLQRCESCHGQAERLLDSAKEMEDSIAVNLSSRRLEVSRLELLLQVGTFCSALGALVAGVFGMNLKSYLEGSAVAFWLTTAGIVLGGVVLFFIMYNHLKQRKVL